MANQQYDHWQGEADKGTIVLQEELNEVHIPKRLKGALGNHRFGRAIDPKNNQPTMAYISMGYDHQEFPKLLYHPEYGQAQEPKLAAFAAGCNTPEQSTQAHEAYQAAMTKWKKKNRTKEVLDAKEEKRLLAKGWVNKCPTPPVALDSPESDEI